MIVELLKHPDYVRALILLKHKPLRFSEIQKALALNPTQVDRALAFLRKGFWIIPQTIAAPKGRIPVQYRIGKRGEAFLASFDSFRTQAIRRVSELGKSEVAELNRLFGEI